jgi:hypothetical protein
VKIRWYLDLRVDSDLKHAIADRAERNVRSLTKEVIAILMAAVAEQPK